MCALSIFIYSNRVLQHWCEPITHYFTTSIPFNVQYAFTTSGSHSDLICTSHQCDNIICLLKINNQHWVCATNTRIRYPLHIIISTLRWSKNKNVKCSLDLGKRCEKKPRNSINLLGYISNSTKQSHPINVCMWDNLIQYYAIYVYKVEQFRIQIPSILSIFILFCVVIAIMVAT